MTAIGHDRIEVPITMKVDPGTYQLRIKTMETPRQSLWLDQHLLVLTSFDVPRGRLIYFGTLEVDIGCQESQRHGRAHYLGHRVQNEFPFEMDLFQQQFPETHLRYKERIDLRVPEDLPIDQLRTMSPALRNI